MSRLNSSSNWSTKVDGPLAGESGRRYHSFQPVTMTNGGSSLQARCHCSWKLAPRSNARAGRIELAVVETAPAGVAVAHVRHPPVAGPQVLGHRNIDLLGLVRVVGVAVGLRVGRFPMPGVRRVDHLERPVGLAERKELLQLRAGLPWGRRSSAACLASGTTDPRSGPACRDRRRSSVPSSPALVLTMKAICGVRPPSLRTCRKDLAKFHVDVAIGHGVGRIEDQRVDARVGQHLGMAANDPGVVAAVVAEAAARPSSAETHRDPRAENRASSGRRGRRQGSGRYYRGPVGPWRGLHPSPDARGSRRSPRTDRAAEGQPRRSSAAAGPGHRSPATARPDCRPGRDRIAMQAQAVRGQATERGVGNVALGSSPRRVVPVDTTLRLIVSPFTGDRKGHCRSS